MTLRILKLAMDKSTRTIDADGHLHIRVANISKANVCPYRGDEIPYWQVLGLKADKVYQLYRDPEELAKAASTFNNKPLLRRHIPVSAEEPRHEDIMGSTGTDAEFVAPYLQNSLVVWDAEAIAGIEADVQRELSCSYRYRADMTSGANNGFFFDGIMRDIVGNHVALVEAGRAGPDVLVGDARMKERPMALTSRKALMTQGALIGLLAPKLAADSIQGMLKDVTAANFTDKRAGLVGELKAKLAKDGDVAEIIEKVEDLLDKIDDGAGEEDDDTETTAADEEDDNDSEEEKKKKALGAARKLDEAAKDKKARDAKRAKDKAAKDAEKDDEGKSKAMDAALKAVETSTVARMVAIRNAEREVAPFVGDLAVAMDSAEAVYKFALDHLNIDVAGVHPSAYPAILKLQPKPGATTVAKLGMDSAATTAYAKQYPNARRLKHA